MTQKRRKGDRPGVVVTLQHAGIGAAIVRRFAADGASVVFSYAGSSDAAAQLAAETASVAIQTDSADRDAAVEAARQMPDGGRIIVIGSVNADRMPVPGMASYAVSKSALQGLARGLARDFGPRGITVNVVQPGPIDTDANPESGPMKELMHSFMAIKRHGRSEEVAGMVAWLAGPEASFVTGAMHTIDGAFGA